MTSAKFRFRMFLLFLLVGFIKVTVGLRGYRQACGTTLHAGYRETVSDDRRCDRGKGLSCKRGICDCGGFHESHKLQTIVAWNRSHCVVKVRESCRIYKSYGSDLPITIPSLTQTEELFCGKGATCTDEGCVCIGDLVPGPSHLSCIPEDAEDGGSAIVAQTSVLVMTGLISFALWIVV